jgi:carbonic anhydrase
VPEDLLEHAIRANVAMQTERLREGSSVLRRLEIEEQLLLVGAVYCLRSGEVEFLDSA